MQSRTENELGIPYYQQVAETIKSRILGGMYAPGERIPSYRGLEGEFKVSNITVRKAIEILVRDGIITRKRGVGSVVTNSGSEVITFEVSGSFERLRHSAQQIPLTIELLEIMEGPCPSHVQRTLSVEPETKIWQMRRVRKHKDTIMSYYIHYSDPHWCRKITKREAEKERFVDLLRRGSGIDIVRLEQRVEAAVANLDLSTILGVSFGAPLLSVENVYYSSLDRPVALTQIYYRGDRHFYKTTAQLPGRNLKLS
jgi:GntR family transcriptional regulator